MKTVSRLEKATVEFRDAVAKVLKLRKDFETPAAQLATAMTNAKEAVQIAAVRVSGARATEASEQCMAMMEEVRKAIAEAERIEAEADHLEKTAKGTVAALYGEQVAEMLHDQHRRCLKAIELRTQAASFRSKAEFLESDAKSTGQVRPAVITSSRIQFANLTAEQTAAGLEDILAALNDGRLEH
jgi:hypothetical protein